MAYILIDVLAKKLTELWHFKNLTYFLTWWSSYLTFDLEKLYTSVPTKDTYLRQVW